MRPVRRRYGERMQWLLMSVAQPGGVRVTYDGTWLVDGDADEAEQLEPTIALARKDGLIVADDDGRVTLTRDGQGVHDRMMENPY